ncbi:SLATT domain-containing protein [Acinetobacter bereziniae]|uniref:SLATT domain-containing protein n=1 Tax=Acinetobacter bereziniae TaxID=106648 RepID=UPI001580B5CD|nr:SLATT domain-containing protein [Acinetobacter bereziniae]NUG65772.1 SLATT domain-containing protein [Acinetobacter bereziniae]NUG68917.1 SLATT domain-containing protein [Acinetobacter bereziniae]WEI22358.1 SLATT domain-containing protein [Acinetobacter bereziniae]
MNLSDKIWWTRKSKIEQETRLLKYEFHSQLLLIWFSFFTVAISILQLNQNNLVPFHPSSLLIFSVLTLVMSCIVSAQKFSSRAEKVKSCYEKLNTLYIRAKNGEDINQEYEYTLNECENHSQNDHFISRVNIYFLTPKSKRKIDIEPPLVFKDFFECLIYKIKYYFFILILYSLSFTSAAILTKYA